MKFAVVMRAQFTSPSSHDAMPSPVSANPTWLLSARSKRIWPRGDGTWKNGNPIGRYSAPNLIACEPLFQDTFWIKSHTLLYSCVGSHSEPPTVL